MSHPADPLALYPAHVTAMSHRYAQAAARGGFDALVIGSGILRYHFQDDQAYPYVADPCFRQWAPLLKHPGAAIVLEAGRQPILVLLQPEDYWHQPPDLPPEVIAARFDLRIIRNPADITHHLPRPALRTAVLGMPEQWDGLLPAAPRNPHAVVAGLHYARAVKTPWEIACIRAAAVIATPGHQAALAAFRAGAGEFDILAAFLGGCRQTEPELPYSPIVALNEHAATLHYQHRDRTAPRPHDLHSLLIDAGCSSCGYACDITRSYAFRDDEFAGMIADMDRLQQALCAAVRPGLPFAELHRQAHLGLGDLLARWDLVRMEPAAMVTAGVTAIFLPHGLGHLLGLQVHDVGGHMADESGTALQPPADFPRLRFLRPLEPGQVVTIEPGVYFIGSLLARLRAGPASGAVNWDRVERLRKFGGIRIEDDVLVTDSGAENLTRPLLGH